MLTILLSLSETHGPESPPQCHLQPTTHSSSRVTGRLSVPCLSHIHVLSLTPCSPPQPLFALSHFPLPDHSCPVSGTTLITSGKLGGPQHGRPPLVGSQHLALTAMLNLLTGLAQLSTPAASRHRLLQIRLARDAQPHDTRSSAQDATTQTAWTMPRRRVRCNRSTPAGAHLDSTDLSGTLLNANAGELSRTSPISTDPSGTSPSQRTTLCLAPAIPHLLL